MEAHIPLGIVLRAIIHAHSQNQKPTEVVHNIFKKNKKKTVHYKQIWLTHYFLFSKFFKWNLRIYAYKNNNNNLNDAWRQKTLRIPRNSYNQHSSSNGYWINPNPWRDGWCKTICCTPNNTVNICTFTYHFHRKKAQPWLPSLKTILLEDWEHWGHFSENKKY